MAMFPANPCQQLVHVRLRPLFLIHQIPAFVQSHCQEPVRRHEAGQPSLPAEQSLEFRLPALAARAQNFFIAPCHQRTAEHSDQSDFIQPIDQRGEESHQIAGLARFEKTPASAHQKRNIQGVQSPLERFRGGEGPNQDDAVAEFPAAGNPFADASGNQAGFHIRGLLTQTHEALDRYGEADPTRLALGLQQPRFDTRLAVQRAQHRIENLPPAPVILIQLVDVPSRGAQLAAVLFKHRAIGMAKSVNGLIDIAYCEKTPPIASSNQIHQPPLQTVGVLQLIHQNLIELSRDPLAQLEAGFEQRDRTLLQIREIDHSLQALLFAVRAVQPRKRRAEQLGQSRVPGLCPLRLQLLTHLLLKLLRRRIGGTASSIPGPKCTSKLIQHVGGGQAITGSGGSSAETALSIHGAL